MNLTMETFFQVENKYVKLFILFILKKSKTNFVCLF